MSPAVICDYDRKKTNEHVLATDFMRPIIVKTDVLLERLVPMKYCWAQVT